jgi:hypothetical protein
MWSIKLKQQLPIHNVETWPTLSISNSKNQKSVENKQHDFIKINKIDCIICFETKALFTKLDCNHEFCDDCLLQIQQSNRIVCPACRFNHVIKK